MAFSGRHRHASRKGRLAAAYGLVLGLISAGALLSLGAFEGKTPRLMDEAVAASPDADDPLPPVLVLPRRLPPSGFRLLAPDVKADLVETTDDGLRLPRIGSTGWLPWIANARRFDPAGPPGRIGLLVINVGGNEEETRRVVEELPGEVSLAFLPGTPDLAWWLARAREYGHESYLMLPADDLGPSERGVRPIEAAIDPAENLRRLRQTMARGEGYVGLVLASPSNAAKSEQTMRPLMQEIAGRGVAVVEINAESDGTLVQKLAMEYGTAYARNTGVLDYKLGRGDVADRLDQLESWVAEGSAGQAPRHAFGVVQPDADAIGAILAWYERRARPGAASFVPVMGHFECRAACMARIKAQPEQLRP